MLAPDEAKLEALVADQPNYGRSAGRRGTKKEFVDIIAGKKTTPVNHISEPNRGVIRDNLPVARGASSSRPDPNREGLAGQGRHDAVSVKEQQRLQRLLSRRAFGPPDRLKPPEPP